MIRALVLATLFLAIAAFAVRADAATFTLHGDTIAMRGEIVAADPLHLSSLLGRGARVIELESPGGLVASATYMAGMIRKAGLTTVVRRDCASACTIMFYAGKQRQLTGRLGFHRATDDVGTRNYTAAMRRFGAPAVALEAARKTPPSGITWIR